MRCRVCHGIRIRLVEATPTGLAATRGGGTYATNAACRMLVKHSKKGDNKRRYLIVGYCQEMLDRADDFKLSICYRPTYLPSPLLGNVCK